MSRLDRWSVADTGKFESYASVIERDAELAHKRGDHAEGGRLREAARAVRETPARCRAETDYRALVALGAKRLVALADGSQQEERLTDERALSYLYGARTEGKSLDQAFNIHVWLRMAIESAAEKIVRPAPNDPHYWLRREILAKLLDEAIGKNRWRESVMKSSADDPVRRSVYRTGPVPWRSSQTASTRSFFAG